MDGGDFGCGCGTVFDVVAQGCGMDGVVVWSFDVV